MNSTNYLYVRGALFFFYTIFCFCINSKEPLFGVVCETKVGSVTQKSVRSLPLHTKNLKVLVLIIASDGTKAHVELQKIWKAYMHTDPKHFEVYFIRGNPNLAVPYEINGDDFFLKCEESYVPGILEKTILSMEAMLPRLKKFDYILRTNLSSFYVFPKLLDFIQTLPREKCYCGRKISISLGSIPKFGRVTFASGAGILLSSDVAEMLVRKKEELFSYKNDLPDDMVLGFFFQNNNIPLLDSPRTDFPNWHSWLQGKKSIPKNAFHFRAKGHPNIRTVDEQFSDEICIDMKLLKMFYPRVQIPVIECRSLKKATRSHCKIK